MHSQQIHLLDASVRRRPSGDLRHGSLWQPVPQRIAVFRALQLGDMLCSIPALRALRAKAPHAHITLIGLPNARLLAERFPQYIDELMIFPGQPEFPEQAANVQALPAFYESARARSFDLAIQLHGSGLTSNAVVAKLGARRVAGFVPGAGQEGAREPYFMPWPDDLPEIHRYIELMRFLGVDARGDHLELPLHDEDLAEWRALAAEHKLVENRYVCVHAGARMPSRRWPLERFAEVARSMAERGASIVLTGAKDERPLVDELRRLLQEPGPGTPDLHLVDLCGKTSLGGLAALVARSQLLICNDTGVSHVAAAVGARSVVIASGSDAARWAPLDRELHPVLAHYVPCRPCMYQECPIDHPCARGVSPAMVIRQAERLLGVTHG